jgi:TRAP-type C4-dicarboxylate transport system permease small subunit
MMEKVRGFFMPIIKWFDWVLNSSALFAGGVIGFTTLIVIYEVIMRYLVKRPTTWVNDISEILLVYCTFLGSAWVLKLGGHTKVDILIVIMKKRGQVIMGIIQDLLSLFFCVVFTYISWESFWDAVITQERTAGGLFSVPLWPVYIVIPIGAFLLCIQLIRQIVNGFAYLSKSHPEESDVEGRIE